MERGLPERGFPVRLHGTAHVNDLEETALGDLQTKGVEAALPQLLHRILMP
jgi:hypothetical protein